MSLIPKSLENFLLNYNLFYLKTSSEIAEEEEDDKEEVEEVEESVDSSEIGVGDNKEQSK